MTSAPPSSAGRPLSTACSADATRRAVHNTGRPGRGGQEHGDLVDIETISQVRQLHYEKITAIEYEIAPGSVAAYYPEADRLVPLDHIDEDNGTPSYGSVPVRVVRSRVT